MRRWLGQWPTAVLAITITLMLAPYVMALFISGKSPAQFDWDPYGFTYPFHFDTYVAAWRIVSRYVLNSIFVNVVSCAGMLCFGTLAAYVFARFEFPGRELMFMLILALLMVPGILTLVPRFVLVVDLGLYGTVWALLLPYIAGGQPIAIFLLRTFIAGIPMEYFDSARIDGANELRCLWNIAVPLSQPILGVVAVLQLLATWNDLFWPFLVIGMKKQLHTIPVGLLVFSGAQGYSGDSPELIGMRMAGYLIASVPLVILFTFTSRLFVEGLASGGLKL